MLIDTHAHLNFLAFREDSARVIKRSLKNAVWLINVGSQYDTSKRAVQLAEKFEEGVYAAVGLHPLHLETKLIKIKLDKEEIKFKTAEEDFDYEKYKELAGSKKVVAIGEIGLDYYWRPKTKRKLELLKEKQKEVFLKQLKLAKELKLPVIFHCRMAHDDLVEILRSKIKNQNSKLKGVMHGFVGTTKQLKQYLEMDFYIGFNGIIFKKIEGINFEENIKNTPIEKILIETDCPYLTPPQAEGRNEPIYVKYIAEKIGKIKKMSYQKIAEITTENAKKLFNFEF